jgi:hypothetical protein
MSENASWHLQSSSSSSGHEVIPINDLFRPHNCTHPIVSLTVVQVFVFRHVDSQGVVLDNFCRILTMVY